MLPMPPDETHFVNEGLTAQEAEARLGKFGPNEPAATQQHSFLLFASLNFPEFDVSSRSMRSLEAHRLVSSLS